MKRNALLIVAVVLALILIALLAFLLLGQGSTQAPPTTPNSTQNTATQNTTTATPATVPPTTVSPTTVPPTTAPEDPDALPAMGEIYITAASVTDTYSEATARVVWENGEIETQPITIRIRGFSSTWVSKKAYNIKFAQKVSLFGMDAGKKWCLISNAYDKSLLRNAIAMEYAEKLNISYVSSTRMCKVYLNDTYLGVYLAMEPVSEGNGRVEIDLDNGDFLIERSRLREEAGVTYLTTNRGFRFEMNEPETPEPAALAAITEYLNQVEDAVRTLDHTVYEEYIDVKSFVDFYILHELFKDIDFSQYSTRYYRKDGILYAGPPWDFDLSMGNVSQKSAEWKYWNYNNQDESTDQSGDSTRGYWAQKDFYMWLWKDEWFRQQVVSRWEELRGVIENLYAENDLGISRLDAYIEAYQAECESNFTEAGWLLSHPTGNLDDRYPADTWVGNVERLRDWLMRRAHWLDSQWTIDNG